MTSLAKWRPGRITAPWQRRVVEADKQRAIDTINGLMTIIFGGMQPAPVTDFEAQCTEIAKLTGEEIANQLRVYWRMTNASLTKADEDSVGSLDIAVVEGLSANISGDRITD